MPTKHYRGVTLKHDHHMSKPETESERRDGLVADLEELGLLAAVDVVGDNTAGRLVEGTAQFGKTAQMTMVRLELQTWDRGM